MAWFNPCKFSYWMIIFFYSNLVQASFCSILFVVFCKNLVISARILDSTVAWFFIIALVGFAFFGSIFPLLANVALFAERPRLILPNLIFCTAILFPAYMNAVFAFEHPKIGGLYLILTLTFTAAITVGVLSGIPSYNECKEARKRKDRTQISFGQHLGDEELI